MVIPQALQIMLWISAGLTALGVIYYKGLRPISRFISETDRSVPVLRSITDKLSDPKVIDILVEMAQQFKTNAGSSLRDVVNRLETSATENRAGIVSLHESTEKLYTLLDSLSKQSEAVANLAIQVADNLADAHKRAREAANASRGNHKPGQLADAYSLIPED